MRVLDWRKWKGERKEGGKRVVGLGVKYVFLH